MRWVASIWVLLTMLIVLKLSTDYWRENILTYRRYHARRIDDFAYRFGYLLMLLGLAGITAAALGFLWL